MDLTHFEGQCDIAPNPWALAHELVDMTFLGLVGPLGHWAFGPISQAFGLGYGPRIKTSNLGQWHGSWDQGIGPWHRPLAFAMGPWSMAEVCGPVHRYVDLWHRPLDLRWAL